MESRIEPIIWLITATTLAFVEVLPEYSSNGDEFSFDILIKKPERGESYFISPGESLLKMLGVDFGAQRWRRTQLKWKRLGGGEGELYTLRKWRDDIGGMRSRQARVFMASFVPLLEEVRSDRKTKKIEEKEGRKHIRGYSSSSETFTIFVNGSSHYVRVFCENVYSKIYTSTFKLYVYVGILFFKSPPPPRLLVGCNYYRVRRPKGGREGVEQSISCAKVRDIRK